jgi:hypothetical protein
LRPDEPLSAHAADHPDGILVPHFGHNHPP